MGGGGRLFAVSAILPEDDGLLCAVFMRPSKYFLPKSFGKKKQMEKAPAQSTVCPPPSGTLTKQPSVNNRPKFVFKLVLYMNRN